MIKKVVVSVLTLLIAAGLEGGAVYAQSESDTNKIVTVSPDEVIDRNYYVNAGEQVEISGTVNGDVVVAGGQILVDGVVNGDVLAAGGTVNISGEVEQDLRVIGGQVNITGQIGRNVTAVAGSVNIASSSTIDGGVLVAAGNVSILGNVTGDVILATENATIAGIIGGNVEGYFEQSRLTSNSRVGGDFTYYSENDANIDKSASVSGQITKRQPVGGIGDSKKFEAGNIVSGIFDLQFKLMSFIIAVIFALILARFTPNYLNTFYNTLENKKGRSLFVGFLAIILTPIISFILLITIIGIPFAVILMFSYVLYLYTAKIFVSYWIGVKLLKQEKPSGRPYKVILVGLLVYYLVSVIPVVDFFVGLITAFAGMGAMLIVYKEIYKKAADKKII